jgi:hypothetical protein
MFQTQETAIKKAFLKKGRTVQATTGAAKPTPPDQTAASGWSRKRLITSPSIVDSPRVPRWRTGSRLKRRSIPCCRDRDRKLRNNGIPLEWSPTVVLC